MEGQWAGLEAEILASVKHLKGPQGLGELSLAIPQAEVCDWNRFGNRKQVGSYTGCCPGEHSSGGKRRLGCIDRMGHGRVRSILVETVWRLLLWQPFWKSARKMKFKLLDGPAMRKKAVG
jgi:transposase